jgi:type I restriction enzyme S subunit
MVEAETKIQRYERYKASGVEWLGEIPEHWSVGRLGSILNPVSSKNHPNKILLSITREKGVIVRDMENEDENHNYIPDDLTGYKLLKKGQFGMNKMKAWQGSYGVSSYTGIVSPAYYTFEFSKNIEPRFFHLAIRSKLYVSFFGKASDGVRIGQWDLSKERMKSIPLAIPPLPEQTAIAQFLDDKTTKIDQAIAIKAQQINLLKERKQILIHKAVTRGLDDSVPLKDSGVEWIGEIPEHWEVKKLFGLADFVRGNTPFSKDELLSTGSFVALQYGKTYKVDKIDDNYSFYVNDEFYKDSQIVNDGDTILISTSETIEDLGHSAYYKRSDLGLLGGEQMLLKPNKEKVNGNYLYFFSKLFSKQLRKYATGIKVFRFNINDLKTIHLSVPPLSEQKEISAYIETASQKIETAISLKQQEIDKLKEYKSSLINGVVTGKVKVC